MNNNLRWVFLDCETTGLEPTKGDRIVEIACVEYINRKPTGREFLRRCNPERLIPQAAQKIHGISDEDVAHEPKFKEVAHELMAFLTDSNVIAHNAQFDAGFLDNELSLIALPPLRTFCTVTDSLKLANELYRGKSNSLDALCDRLEIDRSHRQRHDAMTDTRLLAQIYLVMTRGQESLNLEIQTPTVNLSAIDWATGVSEGILIPCTLEEEAAHTAYMENLLQGKK